MVNMNQLSKAKRAQVVAALVEGNSIRATVRMTGVAKNTVTKLLVDLGRACSEYQDGELQNLRSKRIECDEIWSFCHSKQKNVSPDHEGEFGYGDVWTWVAIDADTKLVPTWLVGERNLEDAYAFIADLQSRLRGRIQLTTDGLRLYLDVVDILMRDRVDYAVLHKMYGKTPENESRYSPATCTGIEKKIMMGDPDPKKISTSYIERQNLTMRMGMRRFAQLTNAFPKKVENLGHAVSLHFMHYNFARPHKTLSKPYPTTPAMAAGIADHVWSIEEIVGLLDAEALDEEAVSN
jgi:IS1 family transposase